MKTAKETPVLFIFTRLCCTIGGTYSTELHLEADKLWETQALQNSLLSVISAPPDWKGTNLKAV